MKLARNSVLLFAVAIVVVFGSASVFKYATARFNAKRSSSGTCESATKREDGYQTVKIFHAVGDKELGEITLYNSADQPLLKQGWTLDEAALWATTGVTSLGSAHNLVIHRVVPKALDDCPVSRDVELLDVPAPRFWKDEEKRWTHGSECTVILRVTLQSSGTVTTVDKGPGGYDHCSELDQIIEAAKQIKFRPALRSGSPITQWMSILYRTH